MTNTRILQIVHEEINRENSLLFEGVTSYTPHDGYRNNKLIESNYGNGRQLLTEGALDTVQTVLDYAGIIPGIGIFIDVVNAGISYFRKNIAAAILNLIAAIPGIGNLIATPFKWIFKKIGKLAEPLTKMFTGKLSAGKVSAAFMKAIKGASTSVNKYILDLYRGINKVGAGAIKWLNKINIANFSKKVEKYSWGWFALPGGFIRAADGFIGRLKNMFTKFAIDEKKIVKKIEQEVAETKLENEMIDAGVTAIEQKEVDTMREADIVTNKQIKKFTQVWKTMSDSDKEKYKDKFPDFIKSRLKVTLKAATCLTPRESNGWLVADGDKLRNKMGNVRKGTIATVDGLKTKVIQVWKDKEDRPAGFKFANGIKQAEKLCLQITKRVSSGLMGTFKTNSKINDFMITQLEKKPVQLWSTGKTVELVQKALGGIAVDGVFGGRGSNTEKAVKKFQKKNGMAQDGVVGPKTWLQLV